MYLEKNVNDDKTAKLRVMVKLRDKVNINNILNQHHRLNISVHN